MTLQAPALVHTSSGETIARQVLHLATLLQSKSNPCTPPPEEV